ncbi:MAG: beta-lactamase family protein [Saprospiraceae bacterium]|nr:beta-lactamase family protein [Saprospiraceae bacterium]
MKFIFNILLLAIPATILTAQLEEVRTEVEKIIHYDTNIDMDQLPGFVLSIIDRDSIYTLPFGTCERSKSVSPNALTLFEIGGLTKVFTALLCHQLESEGFLDLSRPYNSYLPIVYRNKHLDDLTIESLLNHTAGLPKIPTDLGSKVRKPGTRYGDYSEEDLLHFYANLTPEDLVDSYSYSHLNYALIQHAITDRTKKNLEDLFQQYIFIPLEMYNTSLYPTEPVTAGYDRAGRKTKVWNLQRFAGSEGLKSTAGDLTRFVCAMLTEDHPISTIFGSSIEDQVKVPDTKKTFVTAAWHLFQNKKYPDIYLHSGKTAGHGAFIGFVRETHTAVILLTNSVVAMDGFGVLVLRMINDNWKRKKNG